MSNSNCDHIQLAGYKELPPEEMLLRAQSFYELMKSRRSVRSFSSRPVDVKLSNCAFRRPAGHQAVPTSNPGNSWWFPILR